jgi:Phosphodiester glycosidase/SPOR domain
MLAVSALATLTATSQSALAAAPTPPAGQAASAGPQSPGHLDLGPADLVETRTISTPQPGVTLTQITRGTTDSALTWTVETLIPVTGTSAHPGAPSLGLSDLASARAEADRLLAKGYPARVEVVAQPQVADVPAGTLGYRVRVGSYPTKVAADAAKALMAASGESGNSVFTGWDGQRAARGPWHVKVVTIDPRTFRGSLGASYGPDLRDKETTSLLSRTAGATVGVNGGFFVLDPTTGAPGDPAGVGVYGGKLLSEPTNGRPALILNRDAQGTSVGRLSWKGSVVVGGREVAVSGINRVPGLIRNCGGDLGDTPTALPLHDVTCTDDSELVTFTPQFGPSTPTGAGREIVMDSRHVVSSVSLTRGQALTAGSTSLQGIGAAADALAQVHVGDRIELRSRLVDAAGQTQDTSGDTTVVNGGPLLVRDGRQDITQQQDGMVHPGDPTFAYGWVVKRNPRTFAGVDAQGRTVLVTVDGRSVDDLGLSIPEAADVARSLGLVDAINLDGGGSTTMALRGQLISRPSDAAGERPVGDALLVLPTGRR